MSQIEGPKKKWGAAVENKWTPGTHWTSQIDNSCERLLTVDFFLFFSFLKRSFDEWLLLKWLRNLLVCGRQYEASWGEVWTPIFLACTQHQRVGGESQRNAYKNSLKKILFRVTDTTRLALVGRVKQATDMSNGKPAELQSGKLLVCLPFNQLGFSLSVNSAAVRRDNRLKRRGDPDMQSSINHVVVLVVFQPHVSKTRSELPPASACHFTRSSAWSHHMKNDICIGLCVWGWWGGVGYYSCLFSLLHSFLSVTQFFFKNFYLLSEGFLGTLTQFPSLSFPLSETSRLIFMILLTFTPGGRCVQA